MFPSISLVSDQYSRGPALVWDFALCSCKLLCPTGGKISEIPSVMFWRLYRAEGVRGGAEALSRSLSDPEFWRNATDKFRPHSDVFYYSCLHATAGPGQRSGSDLGLQPLLTRSNNLKGSFWSSPFLAWLFSDQVY